MPGEAVPPHGGALVDLLVPGERAERLRHDAPSVAWVLTARQSCDLELLATGAFSPLRGFLGSADYSSVVDRLRLADGTLWPIPVTLDVPAAFAEQLTTGQPVALRDPEGVLRAVLHLDEVFRPDRLAEAKAVYGTSDTAHPGVEFLLSPANEYALAGRLEVVALPEHYDHQTLRRTPRQLRAELARFERVVAFGTRNPLHHAHLEVARRAAAQVDAALLLHPVVGVTAPGDIDHFTRVRCYQAVLPRLPGAVLSLLPLAMRMAGPREALWHALIRQNYGATHFAVGRDHAGPGTRPDGSPFYPPNAAVELVEQYADELAIELVPFGELAYRPGSGFVEGAAGESLSGAELRRRLADGEDLPEWFTTPEVAAELRRRYPPRHRQGFTVLLTGLSGAGKSTVANVLRIKLLERGDRPVTLLDGDLVRHHLSSELGFSREHRDLNVRRVGFVASEITKNGGAALCAMIAPYDEPRRDFRRLIEPVGGYVLVHIATSVDVCAERDRKGLYAKARAGLLPGFTGVSDPYELPTDADVVIDTNVLTAEQAAGQILDHLQARGYLPRPGAGHG